MYSGFTVTILAICKQIVSVLLGTSKNFSKDSISHKSPSNISTCLGKYFFDSSVGKTNALTFSFLSTNCLTILLPKKPAAPVKQAAPAQIAQPAVPAAPAPAAPAKAETPKVATPAPQAVPAPAPVQQPVAAVQQAVPAPAAVQQPAVVAAPAVPEVSEPVITLEPGPIVELDSGISARDMV